MAFWVGVIVVGGVGLATRRRIRPAGVLAAVSVLAALLLTLWPTSGGIDVYRCTAQFSMPFEGLDTLANIFLLYPAAVFLTVWRRRPTSTAVMLVALSVSVEAVQALLPSLGRACDTNDVLMNSVGVSLGALVGWGVTGSGRSAQTARPPRPTSTTHRD